jgi:Transcription factor AFT
MSHRVQYNSSHNALGIEAILNSTTNIETMPSIAQPGPLGPTPPTGQYACPADIKAVLQAHARENNYAIATDCSTAKKAAWVCSKSGQYNSKNKADGVHDTKRRRNTGTTKTGCPFRVRALYNEASNNWTTNITDSNHNHDGVVALSALPHHRIGALTTEEHLKLSDMAQLGHSPTAILAALRHANPDNCLVARDVYNLLYKLRLSELAGKTPVEWLLLVCIPLISLIFTNKYRNSKN